MLDGSCNLASWARHTHYAGRAGSMFVAVGWSDGESLISGGMSSEQFRAAFLGRLYTLRKVGDQ